MRSQSVRRAPGTLTLRMPGRALDANRFPPCAPLCSSECCRERARPSRGIPRGRVRWERGQRGSPRGPLLAIGARAIGPGGRVGGRMTSAAGWTIKARAEPRIQSAPSRRCAALGPASASRIAAEPACSAPSYPPARAAASARSSTPRAPCTSPSCWPASCCSCYSRSGPPRPSPGRRRRWVLSRRCGDCEGVRGSAGGLGGCSPQERAERAGRRPSLLSCARARAGEPSEPGFGGSTSPASRECRQMRSPCPTVASRARGRGREEGKGHPRGRWMQGRTAPHL